MAVKILLASSASNLGARMLGPTGARLAPLACTSAGTVALLYGSFQCRRTILPSSLRKVLTTYCLPARLPASSYTHRSVPG